MKGILGRKLGMTQVFTTDGVLIPVTVVESAAERSLAEEKPWKTMAEAVQLGFEDLSERVPTKLKGSSRQGIDRVKRFVREIRGSRNDEPGSRQRSEGRSVRGWRNRRRNRHQQGPRLQRHDRQKQRDDGSEDAWRIEEYASHRFSGYDRTEQRPDRKRERRAQARKAASPRRPRIWKSSRLMLKTTTC